VLHVMDPGEVTLEGLQEVRFEDPETREAVTLRPRDWAGVYQQTVSRAVQEWLVACRSNGIGYHRITSDTPFGLALREALASPSGVA
jgi:hypothetical protein